VRQALSYPFRRATKLNYSPPSRTVALENGNGEMLTCLVPTTCQKRALMFRNNGLLHRNVISALQTTRGAARIFLRGGAEVMEAKALKRKNCL